MITVLMGGSEFEVEVNGDVYSPHRVSQFVMDEVRLSAAGEYLGKASSLTKDEREFWHNQARKTDLKNFLGGGKKK